MIAAVQRSPIQQEFLQVVFPVIKLALVILAVYALYLLWFKQAEVL